MFRTAVWDVCCDWVSVQDGFFHEQGREAWDVSWQRFLLHSAANNCSNIWYIMVAYAFMFFRCLMCCIVHFNMIQQFLHLNLSINILYIYINAQQVFFLRRTRCISGWRIKFSKAEASRRRPRQDVTELRGISWSCRFLPILLIDAYVFHTFPIFSHHLLVSGFDCRSLNISLLSTFVDIWSSIFDVCCGSLVMDNILTHPDS